ncbi:RNA-binding domain-containing protein [Gigaspora margarita]|uniref:RNA-binding domain-containing protein n=1 Tax=Gigaspora margarita TaxID=4874 RepID=A0A8H3XMV3_GIGMA|nr:RNA-binding domain-containing protein [Gigaspora margarita]
MWYAKKYEPLQAGSIDGTDTVPHDHGILRAQNACYVPPSNEEGLTSDPFKTLFVGRLNPITTEKTLKNTFEKFGSIKHIRLVRNLVTGDSRGYAFIEFTHEKSCQEAYKNSYKMIIDDRQILTDYERSRTMEGWVPRRLGGGFGGRKESGQLRFGARDRPFKRPLHVAGNQSMPEILPEHRFDDCWRRNSTTEIRHQHFETKNNRPAFQYPKDSQHSRSNGPRISRYHQPSSRSHQTHHRDRSHQTHYRDRSHQTHHRDRSHQTYHRD